MSEREDPIRRLENMECDGWIFGDWMGGYLRAGLGLKPLGILQSFYLDRDWTYPQIAFPNAKIGAMAADHLMKQGLENFLFVANRASGSSQRRWMGFHGALEEAGLKANFFQDGPRQRGNTHIDWKMQQEDLRNALDDMPKPLGVFASDDRHGEQVLELIQELGYRIPKEVAVACVSSTPLLCECSDPPLSAFHLDHHGQGELAAEWIFQAWKTQGEVPPPPFAPVRFSRRLSSCHRERKDPLIKQALTLMEENLEAGLSIEHLVDSLPVAKRTLERRFHKIMGQSPAACMREIRIRKTVEALSQSKDAIKVICIRLGWADLSHMNRAVKKATGLTPGEWQKKPYFSDGFMF